MNEVKSVTIREGERVYQYFGTGDVFGDAVAYVFEQTLKAPAWPLPGERAHQDALWFCSGGDQLL